MINVAIFASGSGSNAENIINYFKSNKNVNIATIISNNPQAYVLERAKPYGIETKIFLREDFYNTDNVINYMKDKNIDFIVLAGFLWLVPENITKNYKQRIINIHPALLPSYGGKGMYGMKVHQAIVANGETESGITIHFVNEHYDEGNIIFQAKCSISKTDTAEDLANNIHKLEYEHFPRVIESVINNL